MNRTHRVIWSESRQAFIVTDEKAKAKGKPSPTRKGIVSAVAAALLAMAASPALAASSCAGGAITISTTETSICNLATDDALTVTNTGSISGTNPAVAVTGGNVAASIINSGTISGNGFGIALYSGSSSVGSITNNAGGTISGSNTGITLYSGSSVTGSISNSGTISGGSIGIYLTSGSSVGGITNNAGGTISGSTTGIRLTSTSSVTGGITNSGTISGSSRGIALVGSSSVTDAINNAGGTIFGSNTGIFLGSGSSVGSLTNSGTISSSSTGIRLWSGSSVGSLTNSGTISGNNTGISLQSGSSVGSITNSGTISGSNAIYVDGSSTLPNINITGSTAHLIGAVFAQNTALNITAWANFTSEGTFDVDSFNIANTGTFNMAHGVTTASGFSNAGTLAVADGTTATITGNYTQTASGVLQIGASSSTSYGQLVVIGIADLSASNKIAVNVAGVNTLAVGNTLPGVLTATTLTAGPAYTVTDNSALFNFTAATNGNAVDLTIAAAATNAAAAAVTASGNTAAAGTAAVFDTLIGGTAVPPATADMGIVLTALGLLATQQAVSDAVGQTLPLMTGGMTQATFGNLHGVNRVVQARMEQSRGLSSGDSFAGNRKAWVKPLGSWADQKDRNGAFGYSAQTFGVALGADGELSQAYRIGAAFAYSHSNVDSNSGAQTAGVNSYQAVLYGSSSLDDSTELNWQADYGYNQNKGNRYIAFVNRTAVADYTSSSIHLGAGVGRTMQMSQQTSFTPSVRADYTSLHANGYTETGAGALNLIVGGQTTDEFVLAVDGKMSHAVSDTSTFVANLGVGYDTQAKQNSISAAFAGGGAAFTTNGINPSATLVRGGLGMVINSSNAMEITARYDLEARTGFTGQTASVKLRMPF